MTTATADVRLLAQQVLQRLRSIDNLHTYDTDVPQEPVRDTETVVHPYAVLYPGGGRAFSDRFCAGVNRLAYGFQVTCAGGNTDGCLWCVGKVRNVLTGTRIALPSGNTGRVSEVGSPDEMLKFHSPGGGVRYYLPIDFAVYA